MQTTGAFFFFLRAIKTAQKSLPKESEHQERCQVCHICCGDFLSKQEKEMH